ncbi:hypothetical protein [Paenibacillus sp. Leaf72]|uniref:hypothetical protein n=1 Tax=Paenibacillus sp. Leaf72 TaxID=1736234 RepID=UPI000701DDCB|nr:hypothetical protein [Paenibacillus sp. Leaf72]KQO01100.1 hypothetical protein ASF12_14705 [Paenibacillus sp. Leaf72]
MKETISSKLWNDLLKKLEKPDSLKDFLNYYITLTSWIKENDHYFKEGILGNKRLNVLLDLNPEIYVINRPDIVLSMELERKKTIIPKSKDSILMLLCNTLWELVTIKSGRDCANCDDELRYVVEENGYEKKQQLVLECYSCGWTENYEGIPCNEKVDKIIPANKEDLINLGVYF